MSRADTSVGALFVTAYAGTKISSDELRLLEKSQPAGVILFAPNCSDLENLHDSLNFVQEELGKNALVCIDQEGGRVCRIKGAPAEYRAAAYYGSRATTESLQDALQEYQRDLTAALKFMRELGINTFLGPVCDLDPISTESAIFSRTFSNDPKIVVEFVRAAVSTCRAQGFLCCLKHAPGLGSIQSDPHVTLDSSSQRAEDFIRKDLVPFRSGVRSGAEMVMTSHFKIPDCDSGPVTFSKRIVQELITSQLGADVVLVSDDLQMGALAEFGSPGKISARALEAGHDLLLTRDLEFFVAAVDELHLESENSNELAKRMTSATEKVARLRQSLVADQLT